MKTQLVCNVIHLIIFSMDIVNIKPVFNLISMEFVNNVKITTFYNQVLVTYKLIIVKYKFKIIAINVL